MKQFLAQTGRAMMTWAPDDTVLDPGQQLSLSHEAACMT